MISFSDSEILSGGAMVFYSIPVASMISSINFTELRATILSSSYGFDEPRTSLASPSESRILATQAQPVRALLHPDTEHLAMCYALASPHELRQVRALKSVSSTTP